MGLVVITLAASLIWLRYSNNRLEGVQSSANAVARHWAHSNLPAVIPIYSSLPTDLWNKNLTVLANSWEQSGAVDFQISSPNEYPCYAGYPGVIAVCAFNNPNDPIIFLSYYSYEDNGHITEARLHLNDAYLNSNTQYGTPVWRNYILCSQLGLLAGLDSHSVDDPEDTSCMNYRYDNDEDLVKRQLPNSEDISNMKRLYSSHSDVSQPEPASDSPKDEMPDIEKLLQTNDLGKLVESSNNGKDQLYQKDFENGSHAIIRVLRK